MVRSTTNGRSVGSGSVAGGVTAVELGAGGLVGLTWVGEGVTEVMDEEAEVDRTSGPVVTVIDGVDWDGDVVASGVLEGVTALAGGEVSMPGVGTV